MAKSTSGHDNITTKGHILPLNLQHSYLLYDITANFDGQILELININKASFNKANC